MNKAISMIMILVGVLCGIAVAAEGNSLRYATPLILAAMFAMVTRLHRLDT
ncbi:hypothetical protein G3580_06785 [Nitrogeniibacter mangrovi]|uniref:Uncharacterized protein n=1 Tax=Nitrogeniibacter mangrovi TaxID=2016596 RepID=A0A6C1B3F4_9RHOO|nr:hypothetical protein [Nitrogeniibacter mangrovi]QID17378.1 hypothetical protein G3580_06785 [Nitrogeniibacter mangrovi]